MEIEGYLKKWTNFVSGWQHRYFMLKDGILYYCNKKNTPVKGTIHMKICKIEISPNEPLKITINSGTKALHIKTESVSDKLKWLNALRASKEEIQQYDTNYTKIKTSQIKPELLQKFLDKSTRQSQAQKEYENKEAYMKMINKTISDIWEQQVKLDSALNFLALKFDSKKHSKIIDIIEKTANEGAELIKRVTYCVNIIENEKRRISKIGKEVEQMLETEKNNPHFEKVISKLRNITNLKNTDYAPPETDSEQVEETINDINIQDVEKSEFFTPENKDFFGEFNTKEVDDMFKRASIIHDDFSKFEDKKENFVSEIKEEIKEEGKQQGEEIKEKSLEASLEKSLEKVDQSELLNGSEPKASLIPKTSSEEEKHEEKPLEMVIEPLQLPSNIAKSLEEILNYIKETCPIKYKLVTTNQAYKNLIIPTEKEREKLPFFRNANEKFNIWSIIKDSLGKDLSKIAVPVYLNEPISMLQRFGEQMEYSELLDQTSEISDSGLRMAHVMAFAFSVYSATTNRLKKPFNPLLGETFELICEKKGFRMISEQVSHHPPITAGYCESTKYKYWSNTNVKTVFWGKSIEFKPLGVAHLIINRWNDHFIHTKATSSAENLLIGNTYIDNYGEMTFTNLTTNETGVLNLKKRGWNNKNAFEASGLIKDAAGNVLYKIRARWDKFFYVSRPESENEETLIWEKSPEIPEANMQFNFTKFALQLNYLNEELLKKVAPTDSRLRPDQRSLEFGDKEFALEEKKRLEEKQRASRKEREEKGLEWVPKWFKEEIDEVTDTKTFVYKGGYWEQREKGVFEEAFDLF